MSDDRPPPDSLRALLVAGIATGVIDGLFSSVLTVAFYGSTVTRLFQGVAATILGKSAFDGGIRTAAIGLLLHFVVAFSWSAIFLVLATRWTWMRLMLQSRGGILKVAAVYGPLVWLVMSLTVIPLRMHRPPNIGFRWWIQLIGHAVFVGLPIVASSELMLRIREKGRSKHSEAPTVL